MGRPVSFERFPIPHVDGYLAHHRTTLKYHAHEQPGAIEDRYHWTNGFEWVVLDVLVDNNVKQVLVSALFWVNGVLDMANLLTEGQKVKDRRIKSGCSPEHACLSDAKRLGKYEAPCDRKDAQANPRCSLRDSATTYLHNISASLAPAKSTAKAGLGTRA
eukprot:6203112-Pleurochrysis_carterae.AAC.1